MYSQKTLKTQNTHVFILYNFLKYIFDVFSKNTKNPKRIRFSFYNFLKNPLGFLKKTLQPNMRLFALVNFPSPTSCLTLASGLAPRVTIVQFNDFPKIGNRQ
jgi:hypothetical protein